MIDLSALKQVIDGGDSEIAALVTRGWLAQVLDEIRQGRQAQARLGDMFGAKGAKL